jgi:hypothetical protein
MRTSKLRPAGAFQVPVPLGNVMTHLPPIEVAFPLKFEVLTPQELAEALDVTSPAKLNASVSAETRIPLKKDLGVVRT